MAAEAIRLNCILEVGSGKYKQPVPAFWPPTFDFLEMIDALNTNTGKNDPRFDATYLALGLLKLVFDGTGLGGVCTKECTKECTEEHPSRSLRHTIPKNERSNVKKQVALLRRVCRTMPWLKRLQDPKGTILQQRQELLRNAIHADVKNENGEAQFSRRLVCNHPLMMTAFKSMGYIMTGAAVQGWSKDTSSLSLSSSSTSSASSSSSSSSSAPSLLSLLPKIPLSFKISGGSSNRLFLLV